MEVWEKSSDGEQECLMTEFYNAADIAEKELFKPKNQFFENIIEFLQEREILAGFDEIISFQNCIDAIKKYSEENGVDKLKKNPDKIFESASQAQSILKKLRREKIKPIVENEMFRDLKIIYHDSEVEFFYKNYAHGKFLILNEDFEEMLGEESVAEFLKIRLEKNRRQILSNPQEFFQSAMDEFEMEEMKYLESHAELFQALA